MKLQEFIKDKIIYIILLLFGITTIEIFLIPYNIENFIKLYIIIAIIILYSIGLTIEYIRKRSYYNNLKKVLEKLEQKYLITEIINAPNFLEGKILRNILSDIDKSMLENVNKYKYMRRRL